MNSKRLALALVALVTMLTAAAPAGAVTYGSPAAAVKYSWAPPSKIDAFDLNAIACPSARLCVAVDYFGGIVASATPTVARSWVGVDADSPHKLTSISCPTATACFAADSTGDVLSSSNPAGPAGPAGAWTLNTVDGAIPITALQCPSAQLCVAVDSAGNVLSSTTPASTAAWTVSHIATGVTYDCYRANETGPNCQPALLSISCASVAKCVATDDSGGVYTSTDPAGGSTAWTGAGGPVPTSQTYNSVSCPSLTVCLLTDSSSGDVVTTGEGTPVVHLAGSALGGVSCTDPGTCWAFDGSGRVFGPQDPSATQVQSWGATVINRHSTIGAIGCQAKWCIAIDGAGEIAIGYRVPQAAQLRAALKRSLNKLTRGIPLGWLIKHQRHLLTVDAPAPGTIAFTLTAGRTKIASGSINAVQPGPALLKLQLTPGARNLLKPTPPSARPPKRTRGARKPPTPASTVPTLAAVLSYQATGQTAFTATASFTPSP